MTRRRDQHLWLTFNDENSQRSWAGRSIWHAPVRDARNPGGLTGRGGRPQEDHFHAVRQDRGQRQQCRWKIKPSGFAPCRRIARRLRFRQNAFLAAPRPDRRLSGRKDIPLSRKPYLMPRIPAKNRAGDQPRIRARIRTSNTLAYLLHLSVRKDSSHSGKHDE